MKRMSSIILFSFFVLLSSTSFIYAVEPVAVIGLWRTKKSIEEEKAAIIEIYKCENKYCGKIAWLKDLEALDKRNQDESKRRQKLVGLNLIWGFEFDDDEWVNGKIYNPENGKEYKCSMWLEGNGILIVKGCLVAFFCKKQTWYREN